MKFGSTTIGGMSFGSTKIGGAKYGNTLVYQAGSGPQPVMIPYIRGGADGSYIDTGITADNTVRVIVWARNFNPGSVALFGSRVGGTDRTFLLVAPPAANSGRIRYDFGSTQFFSQDAFPLLSHYHKYEVNGTQFLVDDVVAISATPVTFSNNLNIHLFGCNTNGTHTDMGLPADICAAKIYKGGVLVRDYTPAESPSVGLYDAVSDTLFTNSGNGMFAYGAFDQNAYTPLSYITDCGNAYIDTGIVGSNTLDYVTKYKLNATDAYPFYFACQTTSSSKRYGLAFGNESLNGSRLYFMYNATTKTYNNSSTMNGAAYVAEKSGVDHYLYLEATQKTKQTVSSSTFTTDYNIYVGANNVAGTPGSYFSGDIYYLRFGITRNFVPAKVRGAAGLYDTYNDVFYPSATENPFIAGPTL